MRTLTSEEEALLARRRASFEEFTEERFEALVDFIDALELPEPHMVLLEAERYVPPVDEWLAVQTVTPDDRYWLVARLAYLIGEYLAQKLKGHWFLNEDPDSRYFGRYVVGNFRRSSRREVVLEPFFVAKAIADEPPGRSLVSLLAKVEAQIEEVASELE